MTELEQQLEASLQGEVFPRYAMCSEADRVAAHAQLHRLCRESRRFSLVEVEGGDDGE